MEGETPDPDLLVRAREGDVAAFAQFYDDEAAALLAWFARRTAAADVAADLCAETFATALRSLKRYRGGGGRPPRAWLYGIARNELRNWLRHQRVQQRARRRLGVHVQLPAADELDLLEIRVDLERAAGTLDAALAGLSATLRAAVVLRIVEEQSYGTIALRLGCTEQAARVRVSRGLSQLFDRLNDGGIQW